MSVGDFGMAELREFLEIVLMIHYSFIHHLFYFMQHNLIIMHELPLLSLLLYQPLWIPGI